MCAYERSAMAPRSLDLRQATAERTPFLAQGRDQLRARQHAPSDPADGRGGPDLHEWPNPRQWSDRALDRIDAGVGW